MSDYQETLYQGYGQRFSIDNMLHEVRTEHQHLVIFENARMGRVMALDGVIQTTEADEFIYHEMLTHVPILAHGAARRVLIIGGGDGGMLREVAKHKSVERITMVEIDGTVVDMCKEFLPNHSQGAFDDPRLNLVIDDGMRFVATTEERFDVIISDSTDPIGPGGAVLRELLPGLPALPERGWHPGHPERHAVHATGGSAHHRRTYRRAVRRLAFLPGGGADLYRRRHDLRLGFDPRRPASPSAGTLRQRFRDSGIATRYYNADIHLGAFALPQYVLQAIGKQDND